MKHLMRTSLWLLLLTPRVPVVTAQEKPDFSGSWVLQDPTHASVDTPRMLTIRQPLRTTTALGKPMAPVFLDLTVEKHFESEVRTDTYHIGTEGSSGTFGVFGGNRSSSRFSVRWDGERLRIETRTYPTSDMSLYTEHEEVWWLDVQGNLLITVVDRRSDSHETTRTLIYRRQ